MSTSSITSPHLEADAVTDILEQFYLNPASQEAGNAEEREDVCFYSLYDHRTPKPYPKSPDSQYYPSTNKPFDQELLALKLRDYMGTEFPGKKMESVRGKEESKGQGLSLAGAAEVQRRDIAPAADTGDNKHASKN